MDRLPKILYVVRDDGGCGFYRCLQPATFIKRMGLAEVETVMKNPTPVQLLWADLVIMQEMGSFPSLNIMDFMIKNKIPFVAEIDDFLHHVSPHNLHGYPAWNPGTLFVHRAMNLVTRAAALTVSTNQLAREYFPYNQNIYVVPNYLDKEKWDNPIIRRNDGKVRIGWAGGNAHADDLKMITAVLERIVRESKGKILFETMGMTRQELVGVFTMKSFGDVCPSCGYEGELHHYPGENIKEYPLILASKGWDLAVAPVIDNSFGNCKSDLKIKEYSAIGYPMVVSPVVPYREAAKNGAKLVFAEGFDEWYNKIRELIKNPEKRNKITRANRDWVNQYWIQENARKIFEVYRQVINRTTLAGNY